MRIPTLRKFVFAILSSQMLGAPTPDIQTQTPESTEKETWKQAWTNTPCSVQSTQNNFRNGSLNPPKIIKISSLDLKVSSLVLPNVQGSSQGPQAKWRHQARQMTSSGTKNPRSVSENNKNPKAWSNEQWSRAKRFPRHEKPLPKLPHAKWQKSKSPYPQI